MRINSRLREWGAWELSGVACLVFFITHGLHIHINNVQIVQNVQTVPFCYLAHSNEQMNKQYVSDIMAS